MAKTPKPRPYPGALPTPPGELLEGAIGWRHTKRHTPGRWWPRGFLIIHPDGLEEFDLDGNRLRSSALWAP